jgi:thymidylate synthase (FAD)
MIKLVQPRVFLVGYTTATVDGIKDYLEYTNQRDFMEDWYEAKGKGLSDGECLCSFYAKLCYKSLVPGQNSNINEVRDIETNIKGTFNSAHGSVFEHASINFVATDVSRVFTHELVRMRAGWAYSQTSGRYVRLDNIGFVHDPIMDDCTDLEMLQLQHTEKIAYLMECRKGLRKPPDKFPDVPGNAYYDLWDKELQEMKNRYGCLQQTDEDFRENIKWQPDKSLKNFDYKKSVTSAIRRIAPNGQSNEIGFSINFRALRHYAMLRSNRGAEWEIRNVTQQVFKLVEAKFPMLWYGAKTQEVKGLLEISGMKTQPYEMRADDPEAIRLFSTEALDMEVLRRKGN